jgi:hypothetical protein
LFFFGLLIGGNTYPFEQRASQSTKKAPSVTKKQLRSQKGKIIITQYFDRDGHLVKELEDLNSNGKHEVIKDYDLPNQTTSLNYDTNEDGFVERIETTKPFGQLRKTKIEYFEKGKSGPIKTSEFEDPIGEQIQSGLDCNAAKDWMNSIASLGTLLTEAMIVGKVSFYDKTSFGVLIDESCKDLHKDILLISQAAIAEGISCLKQLGGKGSEANLALIQSLLENKRNPVKIRCDERTGYPWREDVNAYASIPSDRGHPFMSLNPTKSALPAQLKATIFHELFHNCGYRHSHDVEYSYTCETCCISPSIAPKNESEKEIGCKICKGDYQDRLDPKYLKDYGNWIGLSFRTGYLADLVSEFVQTGNLDFLLAISKAGEVNMAPAPIQRAMKKQWPGQYGDPVSLAPKTPNLDRAAEKLVQVWSNMQEDNLAAALTALENITAVGPENPNNPDLGKFARKILNEAYQRTAEAIYFKMKRVRTDNPTSNTIIQFKKAEQIYMKTQGFTD